MTEGLYLMSYGDLVEHMLSEIRLKVIRPDVDRCGP